MLTRLLGPDHRARLAELARFLSVGGVAFVVDMGLFNLLRFGPGELLAEKPITAKVVSTLVATLVSWVGNRLWTFSQHRTELDPGKTLRDTLSPADSVIYRGKVLHVNTWASMFLFNPQQLKAPVRALSGGEQARVHIARLMLEPADVLILDEPTNDLDLATLEVLEESLEEFPGALVLVTHDRAMLARLATHVLALDGRGGAKYFASYEQWEGAQEQREPSRAAEPARPAAKDPGAVSTPPAAPAKRKLSYKEQRELEQIEPTIERAEAEVKRLEAAVNDPAMATDHKRAQQLFSELGQAQATVAALYERWAELGG